MIDDHLHQPWPAGLAEALAGLEQGDVIEGVAPLGYYGRKTSAATTGASLLPGDGNTVEFIESAPAPDGWIVTSQSCDIVEEDRPKPLFPFLKVAPVYRDGPGGDIPRFEVDDVGVAYLVPLTGPNFADGRWVADLRYRQSIDKGLILGATVHRGFATVDEARAFGERLAYQSVRPAYAKPIVDLIVKPLRKHFRKHAADRAKIVAARLRELRLRVDDGPPPVAELVVILEDGGNVDAAREALTGWWHGASTTCKAAGINLLGLHIGTLRSLNADAYAQSDRLLIEWLLVRDAAAAPAGTSTA